MKKIIICILLVFLLVLLFFNIKSNKDLSKIDALNIAEIIVDMTKNNEDFLVYSEELKSYGYNEIVINDVFAFYSTLQDENFSLSKEDILNNSVFRDFDGEDFSDDIEYKILDIRTVVNIKYSDFLQYDKYSLDGNVIVLNMKDLSSVDKRIKNPYYRFSYSEIDIHDDNTVILKLLNGNQSKILNVVLRYNVLKELENIEFNYLYK